MISQCQHFQATVFGKGRFDNFHNYLYLYQIQRSQSILNTMLTPSNETGCDKKDCVTACSED